MDDEIFYRGYRIQAKIQQTVGGWLAGGKIIKQHQDGRRQEWPLPDGAQVFKTKEEAQAESIASGKQLIDRWL